MYDLLVAWLQTLNCPFFLKVSPRFKALASLHQLKPGET